MKEYKKWVAACGNAPSIHEQTEIRYTKDVTLRYPIFIVFDGDKIRLHFSNLTGFEPVSFQCAVSYLGQYHDVTYQGNQTIKLDAHQADLETDEIEMDIMAGTQIEVSIYFGDYALMDSGVFICGPLSMGQYAYGNEMYAVDFPRDTSRKMNWYYFITGVDIHTEEKNHALICYGDSITAQNWPDDLVIRAWENGFHDISIIRRAVSGTRILRQYDNITYAAYGLKGEIRFPVEMHTAGADSVLIHHGINDIIHPVGEAVNIFRPMSDLPTLEELKEGYERLYIKYARSLGYKVYGGTLLPIEGWRTYAPFREELRNAFNDWIRTTDLLDGCVDFDKAVRDPEHPARFRKECDSGDHLHPSAAGYLTMANAVDEALLR